MNVIDSVVTVQHVIKLVHQLDYDQLRQVNDAVQNRRGQLADVKNVVAMSTLHVGQRVSVTDNSSRRRRTVEGTVTKLGPKNVYFSDDEGKGYYAPASMVKLVEEVK